MDMVLLAEKLMINNIYTLVQVKMFDMVED